MRGSVNAVVFVGLFASMVLIGMISMQSANAACMGQGCHGLDPISQGCDVNIRNGTNTPVNSELMVYVCKTSACGGVKWARATRSTFLNGSRFEVWLENEHGQRLSGTEYELQGGLQIYGDMWTGPVRACASIDGYLNGRARCTPVDY
ncbi:MAG: hypothetical protein GFH27_549291n301 [Chloroflexi bacterium AL-W]|nr:hypothetical protein [Chloroflexi bacterium AL-N1]NOK67231.1 hypothetical protein [Chloroflexi bacterium AL-N10]NOK75275.1 hypothetical protein [Chloroflexi bacterium AL-N5]NOK82063.1 hypothetical protein [Chloroflexi bacterium AL-W]NOK89908.1 hypothetical protein [Chloroflexi bacterium AL-N15]